MHGKLIGKTTKRLAYDLLKTALEKFGIDFKNMLVLTIDGAVKMAGNNIE